MYIIFTIITIIIIIKQKKIVPFAHRERTTI
jgi:hypothetical protein